MKRVAVIFGGRAVEHEVSVITGMQVMENLNPSKYEVVPVFITKDGEMFTGDCYLEFKNFKDNSFDGKKGCRFSMNYGDHHLYIEQGGLFKKTEPLAIDVVVLATHGSHGEDGALQGIFETNGIPFTGPSVISSGAGMDKVLMKDIYKANGIPVVQYEWFFRRSYEENPDAVVAQIENHLKYPLFVKPSNLGSSIGIAVAHDREELIHAIDVACSFDRKIIVEEALEGAREFNCAVMGIFDSLETSSVEEASNEEEYLSFEKKYVSGNKSKLTGGNHQFVQDETLVQGAKELAKKAFRSIDARGNARVDILVSKSGEMFVNEINTLPGSCAFYLWEDVGYTFASVLDQMIGIAMEAQKEEEKTNYRFDADLFHKTGYGSKL
ncbi:MAG: D-alanine--D-alanine ligase family protein [Tissierellia bacterium]|nr:D-alanine--D-alanine ligase family protein [Tissierellia bacterium]